MRRLGPGALAAIAAGLLFSALLAYGLVRRAPDTTIDDALSRGQSAAVPAFRLAVLQRGALGPRLDGRLAPALGDGWVSTSELVGTPYVVNIWASWCVPCREEAPVLERGWRAARGRGVAFVGLDMQDAPDDARAFLRRYAISYLNIRDPTNAVYRRFGATGIPETWFVSARGRVVGHVIGVIGARQLADGVEAALRGLPAGARRGGDQRPSR